jgi:sucrose phosphorylase
MVDEDYLERCLAEPDSKLHHIKSQFGRMLEARVAHEAFRPDGDQRILSLSPSVFAVLRSSPDGGSRILALTNVTDRPCRVEVLLDEIGLTEGHWYDLLQARGWTASNGRLLLSMQPYDVFWLSPLSMLEKRIESGASTRSAVEAMPVERFPSG